MKKRLVSILLVLVMVLGMLPTVALAEDTGATSITQDNIADVKADGNYILADDIIITEPFPAFSGTFDGNGYTVTLDISGNGYVGMFKNLTGVSGKKVTVKNVIVEGKADGGTGTGCGSIAGVANSYYGDIVIEECINRADITGGKSTGGILGQCTSDNTVTIKNCANFGLVTAVAGSYAGGIVGNMEGNHAILNCYNRGDVVGFNSYAGICGRLAGTATATNCYFTGSISKYGTSTNVGCALIGNGKDTATATNLYALEHEGVQENGENLELVKNAEAVSCAYKTEDEMKSQAFAGLLGGGFTAKSGDYPILEWETPTAKLVATLNQEEATFTVTGDASYSGEGASHTVSLPAGSYTWTASCEGYVTQSGDITVTQEQANAGDEIPVNVEFVVDENAATLESIAVEEGSYKAEYKQGDALDEALTLVLTYSDGSTKNVTKGYEISGFDSKEVTDSLTLTVTYKGLETTFTVKITEKPNVFLNILDYADVSYSHNKDYNGVPGEEFVYDNAESALKSNSKGMDSSQVTVNIQWKEAAPPAKLSFQYKVSSEASSWSTSDGLQINGASKIGGEVAWTAHSLTVKPGDTVTLTYAKDYSTAKGSDCMWLKGFSAERLYTITLTTDPADAKLTLKDSTNNTVSGSDGVYAVVPGSYSYEASAFGCKTATGTVEVTDDDVSQTITLEKDAGQDVTFAITLPEGLDSGDCTITINQGSAVVRTLNGKTTTNLPAGEYSYTISHPNCSDVTGNFTVESSPVTEEATLEKKLTFGDFFKDCDGIRATNDETRPWVVYEDSTDKANSYLTTKGVTPSSGIKLAITLTANEAVRLSFDYSSNISYASYRLKAYQNDEPIKTFDQSYSWTNDTFDLAKGDVLKLELTTSGIPSNYVNLKNFKAEKLATATFTVAPEDATLEVKNAAGTVVAPSDGLTYVLPAGEYSYTVSKFGYETATGTMTLSGGDNKTIDVPALTKLLDATVTFDVKYTADDCADDAYTVTIMQGTTKAYEGSDASCTLPAGEYTYTVSHPKCKSATGDLTVTADGASINVTLARTLVFDDFFKDCDGIAAVNDEAHPFKVVEATDEAEAYLTTQGYNENAYYTVTLTASKAVKVSFDYFGSPSNSQYYPFTVQKGSDTLLKSYDSSEWKSFSAVLAKDDVLTLSVRRPSTSESYVHLKNFRAGEAHVVSFNLATDGAALTVKDEAGSVIAPAEDGSYLLIDGKYTYTASKFGYTDKTGTFTVSGKDQTIKVTALKALATGRITFKLTPSDAVVTVTHETAGEQTPSGKNVYTLVKGETYSYSIERADYMPQSGTITVTGAKTITVALTYAGESWDGTTTSAPAQKDGVYQISTAAELAWFAARVKEGEDGISADLTENINLNGNAWTEFKIGVYDWKDQTAGYHGVFNGNYHTISGLTGESGIFNCIGKTGVVKNLIVDADISGSGNIGIISNIASGTIENCVVIGKVSTTSNSAPAGGILGNGLTGSKIAGCANLAEVACKASSSLYVSNSAVGGIVGYTYGTVENCYSTGSVSSTIQGHSSAGGVGGLVGAVNGNGMVKNSYAAGTVSCASTTLGAFAGKNEGTIAQSYYLERAAGKAIGLEKTGSAAALTAMTEEEMKSENFIKNSLGIQLYHKDTENINSGYPIFAWQGGTALELSKDDKNVTLDAQALKLRDLGMYATIQALRAQADAEVDAELDGLTLLEMKAYIEEVFELTTNVTTEAEARAVFHEVYYLITEESYKEETGIDIDLTSDGTLTPDGDGVYHITRAMTLAPDEDGLYTVENPTRLELVAEGENGSTITWTASDAAIDTETGLVTLPESETSTVTLTAAVKSGKAEKNRDITVVLYSAAAEGANVLDEIAAKLSEKYTYIQPVQIRGHANAANALSYWLYENGYDDEAIGVSYVSAGEFTSKFTTDVTYLAEDGTITYYGGEANDANIKYVSYTGAKFQLAKDGATKIVTANVRIGWDIEKAKDIMNAALDEKLSWENIRGENTQTTATEKVEAIYGGTIIDGAISDKLKIPQTITSGASTVQVGVSFPSEPAPEYQFANGNIEILPSYPKTGTTTFDFQIVTLFDQNLDDYTLAAMKNRPDDTTSALKLYRTFHVTVGPKAAAPAGEMSEKLKEIYPTLMLDFYDQKTQVDFKNIKNDIQLPRLSVMSQAGIFDYVFEEHNWKILSSDKNVIEPYGYHLYVYRPLPGSDPVDVTLTVQICERTPKDEEGNYGCGKVFGEAEFTLTVQPLTQEEIDAAAALMKETCTEEVYWNGIRNANTDKNAITSDMHSFYRIKKNADGTFTYLVQDDVKTNEGICANDLPGYDSMEHYGVTWRQFRSSANELITHENLLLARQPEYDTKVTIDSCFTYDQYARYYTKFYKEGATGEKNQKYAEFAQFYKQPVSVTVTVKGEKSGTYEPETMKVKLTVDGRNVDKFKKTTYTYEGVDPYGNGVTVYEVMQDFFANTDYTYDSFTSTYIASIIDPKGVTLTGGTNDRPYSGWLFSVNEIVGDKTMGQQYVVDGDEVTFFFTTNYLTEDKDSEMYKEYKALADDVIARINAIPKLSQLKTADKSTVENARKAYDELYYDEDNGYKVICDTLIPAATKKKLTDAEEQIKALETVETLIDAIPAHEDGDVYQDMEDAIVAASAANKELSSTQRKLVADAKILADYEKALTANQKKAASAQKLIESLLKSTTLEKLDLNDRKTVEKAWDAYADLSDGQKSFVTSDVDTLTQMHLKMETMVENEAAIRQNMANAAKVDKLIKALPKASKIKYTDEAKVVAAEKAYQEYVENLNGMDNLVENVATLTEVRVALDAKLAEVADKKAAAQHVTELIEALPSEVVYDHDHKDYENGTLDHKQLIEAARDAYDALDKIGKSFVEKDTLKKLTTAEKTLKKLVSQDTKDMKAAQKVIAKITNAKFPELEDVTTKKKSVINAAKNAYGALNANAKKYADENKDEIAKLEACVAALNDQLAVENVVKLIKKCPDPAKLKDTTSNRKKVLAAKEAYDDLTENQYRLIFADYADEVNKLADCCRTLEIEWKVVVIGG